MKQFSVNSDKLINWPRSTILYYLNTTEDAITHIITPHPPTHQIQSHPIIPQKFKTNT